MFTKFRSRLTYANVVSTLCLFILLGGGAYAVSIAPRNSVKSSSIKNSQVKSVDVRNNSLTGADINEAKLAGVKDGCTAGLLVRYGRICVGAPSTQETWDAAFAYCTNLGLRLPSLSEARALAANFDVPGVPDNEFFWTDSAYNYVEISHAYGQYAWAVREESNYIERARSDATTYVVCVTEPTNAL